MAQQLVGRLETQISHQKFKCFYMNVTIGYESVNGGPSVPSLHVKSCDLHSNSISKSVPRGGTLHRHCTPTRDRGQSQVKRSRRNFGDGQAVQVGIRGSIGTVKGSSGDRWAWLMLRVKATFWCGQGVKHETAAAYAYFEQAKCASSLGTGTVSQHNAGIL